MKRILGVDYGLKRIGLAISDSSKKIALPWKTIEGAHSIERASDNLIKAINGSEYTIDKIVIGNPLLMSGKSSDMSEVIQKFANILGQKLSIPVILWDERLSSLHADKSLKELKMNRKKRTKHLDTVSATFILQNYLDCE